MKFKSSVLKWRVVYARILKYRLFVYSFCEGKHWSSAQKIILNGTDDLKQLNKTIWGTKLEGTLCIQDQHGLQSKFQAILGYIVRPYLKQTKNFSQFSCTV